MANICTNRFKVTGPAESVAELKKLITNEKESVEYWNGETGPVLMDLDKAYGEELEHQWAKEFSGPVIDKPGCYCIYFETRWGKPDEVYERLAERFPDCTITVWDWIEGNEGGKTTWKWNFDTNSLDITESEPREDSRFRRLIEDRQM